MYPLNPPSRRPWSQVYNAKLSGYHFYHKGTTTSWRGVGLFIKESLSISICKEFDLKIPNCEDMWIQLDLGNNKKCIVGVIYRHPKQKLSEFCYSFESTIEKMKSRKWMNYIEGDFNADFLKSNSDTNIKDFMNLTYSLGCIPLITHPTRITTTSSTLLDHVYTNNVPGEHKSFILVEDVSNHLPVMVCFNLSLPKREKSTVTQTRDTKNFDIEKILDKLTEEARACEKGGSGGTSYLGPGLGGPGLKGHGRVQVFVLSFGIAPYSNTTINLAYSKNIGQPIQYW